MLSNTYIVSVCVLYLHYKYSYKLSQNQILYKTQKPAVIDFLKCFLVKKEVLVNIVHNSVAYTCTCFLL